MIKERNEIDSAYMWDLTPLFKSDEEWEKELDSFDEKVSALVKYQGTLKDAKTIHGFYEELTEVSGIFEDLFCYASLRRSEDTRESKAQQCMRRLWLNMLISLQQLLLENQKSYLCHKKN